MLLARMMAADEDALACDFAETYRVLDFRVLPARKAAQLASGLGQNSRIMQALTGAPADLQTILLALVADAVRVLVWQNTRDGAEGRNQPKSILAAITGEQNRQTEGFDSAEDFERWRQRMLGGETDG